jgi:hypothetical protein
MTNDERSPNFKTRLIRTSDFFRHSSFVIRHWTANRLTTQD